MKGLLKPLSSVTLAPPLSHACHSPHSVLPPSHIEMHHRKTKQVADSSFNPPHNSHKPHSLTIEKHLSSPVSPTPPSPPPPANTTNAISPSVLDTPDSTATISTEQDLCDYFKKMTESILSKKNSTSTDEKNESGNTISEDKKMNLGIQSQMTQQLNWRIKLVSGSTVYGVTVHGPLKKKLDNKMTMSNALQTLKHITDMSL